MVFKKEGLLSRIGLVAKILFYYTPFYLFCLVTGRVTDKGTLRDDLENIYEMIKEAWVHGEI